MILGRVGNEIYYARWLFMFKWFRKKMANKQQLKAPPASVQQLPSEPPIEELDRLHRAESETLYQERQKVQSGFDPYAVDCSGSGDCKLSSVEQQFLKKIAGQPVEDPYVAGYWGYEYGLSFPTIMTKLLENGYLKIGSAADNLNYLIMPELKDILKQNGLAVSGKKAELIARINENVPKDVLVSKIGKHKAHYILTDKGMSISGDSPVSITKDVELEDACLAAIHQNDFNTAYKMIAKRELGKRSPRGIGIDWEKESRDGLSDQKLGFYARIISDTAGTERTYRECIILADMLGVSNPTPLIKRLCKYLDEELLLTAQYERKKSEALLEIESYKALELQSYEILGAGDKEMCSRCRSMNGKRFLLSEAQIGVNFPPFCKKCRCTTVPAFDD